jgi:response regulator RpfG family c-di-GMP phosphodiesterase
MLQETKIDKAKILFVDDEPNVLQALKRVFMDEPYELFTAQSGKEALQILSKEQFAVIVSDQRMPEMGGSEFLGKARTIQPDAARIVLTGYADVQAAVGAINEGGASRYIAKPWNDTDLVMIMRETVASYRLRKENIRLTELTKNQNEELNKWNADLEVIVQNQTIDIQNKNKDLERLVMQLNKNFKKSIEAFSNLIEMREKTVSSHSKNVALLARQMAVNMKLPDYETNNILVAALLHDVGKIGVPDIILVKRPDDMTDIERTEYQRHAILGQVAVDAIDGFTDIGLLIRHHHEYVDGSGYPDRLKRSAIPLGSRIIAMADAFDRITNISTPSTEGFLKALKDVEYYLDTRYDRTLYQQLSPIITKKIEELGKRDYVREREIEVQPENLSAGMVLSRDLRSGSGLLILSNGAILNTKTISGIQRYHQMDPYQTGVFVRMDDTMKKK